MKNTKRIQMVIAILLTAIMLSGCANSNKSVNQNQQGPTAAPTAAPTAMPTVVADGPVETRIPNSTPVPTSTPGIFSGLTDKQRDSISMLNHLTVLTQQINSSRNSRLYLEGAYSSIVNNTYPNAVDNRTLGELNTILDTLEEYRMIAVKRDRLEFVYEQNQAQALRSAIPNPLGLISAVRSFNIASLVASVAYMAIDSVASYQTASSQAEMQYLQDGWALDDEQARVLHNQRKDMFNYMVRTVNENDLPGELALTEETVADLVEWENNPNVTARIQFLESKEPVYKAYGGYWLILARSYYEHGDYQKCLNAIESYEQLGIGIFRQDFDYAEVLPLAIVAAGATMEQDEYVVRAAAYADSIIENSADRHWALRYFAAQTYVDLYGKTGDRTYLQKAFDITLNNVNHLVKKQHALNETYLAPVVEAKADKGATKAQQEEIKQYNTMLKETRKTELPPVYEPLLLNSELLFSISEELGIPTETKERVGDIIHHNGEKLFLVEPLDSAFQFTPASIAAESIDLSFDGKKITIPARYMSSTSTIHVTVSESADSSHDDDFEFDDWQIEKVDRKTEGDLNTFTVVYSSKTLNQFKYSEGMIIRITITPYENSRAPQLSFAYEAVKDEKWWIIPDGIKYQRTK